MADPTGKVCPYSTENLSYGRSFVSKTGTATYTFRDEEMYLPLPCTLTLSFSTVLSDTSPLSSLMQNSAIWDMDGQACAAYPAPTSPTIVKTSLTTPLPTTSTLSLSAASALAPEVVRTSNRYSPPGLSSMTSISSSQSEALSLDFAKITDIHGVRGHCRGHNSRSINI